MKPTTTKTLFGQLTRTYTVSGKKGATLFSTITLAFLGGFLIIFIPLETGMKTPQTHVIYLLNGSMTSFCETSHVVKVFIIIT